MKKILNIFVCLLTILTLVACDKKSKTLSTPTNLTISDTGLITWDAVENASEYVITINQNTYTIQTNSFQVKDLTNDFTYSVVAKADKYETSLPTDTLTYKAIKIPKPDNQGNITIAIKGGSEVKSTQSITLSAVVEGTSDTTVSWEIKSGQEYATISNDGKLTAKEVNGDKIIEVIARSNANNDVVASKVITIVAKPELTQTMLDQLNVDKVSFEGYVNINLYTIGLFEKFESTYTTVVKTAMNGINWYAEYENADTGTVVGLYYKKHNNVACQVGVSFMNDEEYFPMIDEKGKEVSWTDSGLYNGLKDLKVSDFEFNEETWRYEYSGNDTNLAERIIASANPYDFDPTGFALIIEDGEVMGIYSKSNPDYSIYQGYKAIQELTVVINYGDSVEVPTITKYSHDDIHDELQVAINNMQALESYTLDFKEITASYITTGYTQIGFTETITNTNCHFRPYKVKYDTYGNEYKEYTDYASYGYKKIRDNLYNTYHEKEDGTFYPSRAYASQFNASKPTFAFAPEIFREYFVDEVSGTTTYYVDDVMSSVASTFYYGVGNDINLYGIFATRGYTSSSSSFTPYVVVKDGYIIEACFYFYIGTIYGVVEITYDDFNSAVLPDGVDVNFTTREVPTSWSELTIEVTGDSSSTGTADDYSVNALEYLKEFYNNENIEEIMPFFGNALGDTYGFGLTTIHISGGTTTAKSAIVFYYDVPLDIDYSITSSLDAVCEYLESLGFVKNAYNEYTKGDIVVAPTDSSLDLMIYVWKA